MYPAHFCLNYNKIEDCSALEKRWISVMCSPYSKDKAPSAEGVTKWDKGRWPEIYEEVLVWIG